MVRHTPAVRAVLAILAAGALALGCGSQSSGGGGAATLVLDRAPNGSHAGIHVALARDFDGAEGVRLRVREKAGGGGTQLRILSAADLLRAQRRGENVVAVAPLASRPLAVVFVPRGERPPRDAVRGGRGRGRGEEGAEGEHQRDKGEGGPRGQHRLTATRLR